jgi:flavin reductase (DIM6/NTAB) family NADH-FMN oxidoreductase RutF
MIFKSFRREEFLPLPITFLSTISADGVRNIAPYACVMPVLRPLDLICLASAYKRDTLKNIRDTGEFVVNLAGTDLADKVIPTAKHTPPEADEFLLAGLIEKPSATIRAPGIAGCYAWMECKLHKAYEESNYVLIVGKVLQLEVADDVLTSEGTLDVDKAKPLMMVGGGKGMRYCTIVDINKFEPFGAMFADGKDPLEKLYSD